MTSSAQGSLVVFAWLDSTGSPDLTLAAISGGNRISPEAALARLFPDGLAGASRVLPWLQAASRPDQPMCAYAAIVDDPQQLPEATIADRGSVRSGLVLHPDPDDVSRLRAEFRTVVLDVAGTAATQIFDSVRRPADAHDRIEIKLFEGAAYRAGREIALSDGEFAVAAVLAMNRQTSSREAWCDKLWPERDPESAARLLKVYVHRIRAKFDTNRAIDTYGGSYRLGHHVRVDIHSLEALLRKHGAGTKPLAPGQLRNVERAFDGFKDGRYRRLASLEQFAEWETRFAATGAELARVLLDDAFFRDDGERALAIAEDLAAIDPYDDVAAELLIRAMLRLGRRDAASRHLRAYSRTLRDELDLPPPQHLAQLLLL